MKNRVEILNYQVRDLTDNLTNEAKNKAWYTE